MRSTLIIIFILFLKLPSYSNTEKALIDSIYQNRDNFRDDPEQFLNRLNSIEDIDSLDKKDYAIFTILETETTLYSTEEAVKDDQLYRAVDILKECDGEEYNCAYGLLILGYARHRNFDNETAIEHLYEGIKYCKKIDEHKLMGDIYLFLGSIEKLDLDNRTDMFHKAYDQFTIVEDHKASTNALYYLIRLQNEILIDGQIFNVDSIVNRSQKYNYPNLEANVYRYIAREYRKDRDILNFINYTLKAYSLRDKLTPGNRQTVCNEYLFTKIYRTEKERYDAIADLNIMLEETASIQRKSRISWHIYKAHQINKDYKQALAYKKLSQKYDDQALNNENEKNIISSLNRYKTLEMKEQLIDKKLQHQRLIKIIITITSTLALIIIISVYRKRTVYREKRYLELFSIQLSRSQNQLYNMLAGIPKKNNSSTDEYMKFCNTLESKIKIETEHSKILRNYNINTVKAFEIKAAIAKQFPELTDSDITYCTFIYQSIRNEEIGKLTNTQTSSVRKRKLRLAKKIDIKPDQDLETVIKEVVNLKCNQA